MRKTAEILRKVLAGTISASLLLVTPGTSAIAQQFTGPKAAPVRAVPVAPGAAALSLPKPSLAAPGMVSPALPTPVLTAPSLAVPRAAAPQAAAANPVSRIAAPLAARKDAPGLIGVIGHQLSGRERGAPAAASFIRPSAETSASASASKDWGEAAFSALRGEKVSGASSASAVAGSEASRRPLLGRPSLTVNAARQPSVPGPAGGSKAVKVAKIAIPLALAATGLAMYAGFIPMFGLAGLFSHLPTFSASWPTLIAVNIGLSAAMIIGKKWWAKRKEAKAKAEEKARKEEAAQDLTPSKLEGEAAVAAVTAKRGTDEGVSVYDFSTGVQHSIPVDDALIEMVKQGKFKVSTDATGAVYLVPVLAEEAAKAEEAPKAAEPAKSEEAPKVEEAVKTPEAVKASEAPAPEPTPAPAARKGNNPSGKTGTSPKSLSSLPKDARGLDAATLAKGKAEAQARARRLAPDARLIRVTINLDDPRAHPVYVFHSKKKGQLLKVWTKRIGVSKGDATTDALWDSRLADVRPLSEAYAALKAEAHWFKPVRVELVPRWKAAPEYVFIDARGRTRSVSAALPDAAPPSAPPTQEQPPAEPPASPVPTPVPDQPAERGPPAEGPSQPPAPPETPPPDSDKRAELPQNGPHIHEDLFGFRRVRGVRRDPALITLTSDASAAQVIDRISRQFGIARDKVVEMGRRFGLHESSERAAWLAVHDRLQRGNRAEFEHLDHKKYNEGLLAEALGGKEASFRRLANRTYPAGWKGRLVRALELHKHLAGLFIRLPYHLFDQFLFGFFRRAVAYEFFRGNEDFFAVREALDLEKARKEGKLTREMLARPPLAERWLESAMQQQFLGGTTALQRFMAKPWARSLRRWLWTPLASPLLQFTWRRATLAVFSAAAMGFVYGLVPLPALGFQLVAVPVLGPALAWLSSGLPAAAAGVPFIGEGLSAVLGHAMHALVDEMTVGSLLSTFTLSTALTFPNAVKARLMEDRGQGRLTTPKLRERAFWHGVVGTFFSARFWLDNLKSFLGLVTVGAEIEAIMGYAGGLDAAVTPAFKAVTGHEFKLFHTVAAAVERPQGESPIPFGGAITWGNVLIYKLQNLVGFNLTDETYRLTRGLFHGDLGDPVSRTMIEARSAAPVAPTLPGAEAPVVMGGAPGGVSVVAAAVSAVAKAGAGTETKGREPGDIEAEIRRVREAISGVESRISGRQARLAELEKESNPVTEAEERAYQETLRLLTQKADRSYVESKLAEIEAIRNPQGGEALAKLEELGDYYRSLLPAERQGTGYLESLGVRLALMHTVKKAYDQYLNPEPAPAEPAPRRDAVDSEAQRRIGTLVGEIERLRGEARAELANRDALERLLSSVSRARNLALQERRGGKEMLEFHKNMARLATVMDLAFSLNTIEAAQKAILDMQKMLDAKLEKIRRASEQAERDRAETERQRQRQEEWRREVEEKVKKSKGSLADMVDLEDQTRSAVENIGGFRADLRQFLATLDAADRGQSATALAEYNRRKALLPTLVEWNANGKPGDEDFTSVKGLREHMAEVDDYIAKVDDGLSKIGSAPVEFAGVLVVAVPGVPAINVANPSQAQTLQILAARKAHWQAELDHYKELRDEFRNRLDPNYGGTEVDDFGDTQPLSLPRRLARAQADVAAQSAAARDLAARIDAAAAEVRAAAPNADLPALTGLGLEAFRAAIEAYPDKLDAVTIPSDNSSASHNAKMALLKIGRLIPPAGRAVIEWSKADATVTGVQDAMASPVPQAAALYANVVSALERVVADVDADVAYVQAGFPAAQNQALIDRKRALLEGLKPMLLEARATLRDHALPFQESTVRSFDPNGDKWAKLFNGQVRLYEGTRDAVDVTLPWGLASYGAREGDTAGGLANIESQRKRYRDLITGYDDAAGHHTGVDEHLAEIAKRKDPNNTDTEEVYGQVLPFSLPRVIEQFTAEKAQRAQEMNRQNADINAILDRVDQLTGGKHNLAARKLPVGIGVDPGSVDRVQALVDARTLQNLGDALTELGNEYKDKAGDVSLSDGQSGLVPSGVQPTPTVDTYTQVALLALEAAKRLVPSSVSTPESAPAAYAVARFLYSDGVVDAAQKNLYERIPIAETFLNGAKTSLNEAIADLAKDEAYVRAGGSGESADAVIDRKIRVYSSLNAVTRAGVEFYGLKVTWDEASFDTVRRMGTYYDSTRDIYENSGTVGENEAEAIRKMKEALQKTFDDLEEQRKTLTRWMAQLNDPHESALKRVGEDLRKIQEKTRAVLEANFQFRDVEERFKRSEDVLGYTLSRVERAQTRLAEELRGLRDPAALDPGLRRRIEALRFEGSSWYMGADTGDATAALVVPKRDFGRFVDTVFSALLNKASSARDLSALKRQLLENPSSLSDILPNSSVIDFGDADGFYMVYQSQFSVPHGLETSNWVTLGNVARLWGNNVSVTGYQFGSPPNEENAPWGDKGVDVQIESIQGKNWVNYLNIDFHRFIQDIPPDTRMASTANQSRIMIFEDFAVLLFGDRLYVAFTGFADGAVQKTKEKPYFYGGSFKSSLKFTEVMRLNAEQQQVFAKDPRFFLQTINLDFTGLDPDLNQNFVIESHGENKRYKRTQVGPSFDVARLIDSQDAFTVDLYWARQEGTDDYDQDAVGVSVLKGFTLRAADGKPWAVITNRASAEFGGEYNTYSDRATVTLPNWGVAVSAEGRLIGDARTYYLQAGKKMSDSSEISVGYGTKYPGMPERLTIQMNTSFTLGQLWRHVAQGTADELSGGDALKGFDASMDAFYKAGEDDPRVQELKAVFQRDVASRLVRQDMGRLVKDLQELRRAGAFMDNTRVRGMVGFVSNPVSDFQADRALGGGFTAGTQTTMTLNKTQKALVEQKAQSIYREGLRLQLRMMELTKQWQQTLIEVAEAQWELKLAKARAEGAPDETVRREGAAAVAAAELRLRQAAARYNALVGRPETEALPFTELSAPQLEGVLAEIRRLLSAQDPLVELLKGLDHEALKAALGGEPFNLVDWIPWVEQITFSMGAQFQDFMANQVLGVGGSVRLPIYDPASKERDKAYRLETSAARAQMLAAWEEFGARAERERLEALGRTEEASILGARAAESAAALDAAVKGYRNGLVSEARLREAFEQWRFYVGGTLSAGARASLARGWATLDQAFYRPRPDAREPARVGSFQEAFDLAAGSSRGLDELELRRDAAAHMAAANASRIQKFYADLFVGWNITSSGVGWLPSFGLTGMAVTPILTFELKTDELRDLQVRQGEGQEAYYAAARTKLEADLALEFYRQTVAWHQAGRMGALLERETIPALEAELARAGGLADPAQREEAAARAQRELDAARRHLAVSRQDRGSARAALNHLLGRAPEAPLSMDLTPERALADLQAILAAKDPVAADRAVLQARVDVAEAVQTMADKNLKVDELRVEPVSLVVRSLGRLVRALSETGIGNPDVVAAARIQTLEAQRARDAYSEELPVRRAQLEAELAAAESALRQARSRGDARGAVQALELEGAILTLKGALARLQTEVGEAGPQKVPATFAELVDRAAAAEQSLTASGRQVELDVFEPERSVSRSIMGFRWFDAKQSMGRDPINQQYLESWVEFRLRSPGTPEEVLLALSRLRTEKASRMHRNDAAAARARSQVLVSEFEATVRLKRWLDAQTQSPVSGSARRDLEDFRAAVERRLQTQGARLKALLHLEESVTPARLAALVPADAAGRSADVTSLAQGLLSDVRRLDMARLRETVFEGGIPESFGNEDSLIQQIRADVIAERMSYKGFTPVAAFGLFRAKQVWGVFLEAPDPRSIEAGLQRVLSDAVRKELESQGRMRELSLRLHLLMSGVEGRARLAERQAAVVQEAEADYLRAAARLDRGLGTQAELMAAQDALVRSWLELSGTLAELKSGFITLVSELEALGYDPKKFLAAPIMAGGRREEAAQTPAAKLAAYVSRRALDEAFSAELEAALGGLPGGGAEAAQAFAEAARAYREMAKAADDARHHPDLAPAERLRLLTQADAEGRRQAVEAVAARVLEGARSEPRAREAVFGLLLRDVGAQTEAAAGLDARERALAADLRRAVLDGVRIPAAVRGQADEVERLRGKLEAARNALREDGLRDGRRPEEFLLTDQKLDDYIRAQAEYDRAVVRLFAADAVKGDSDLAWTLDGLYRLDASLQRQKDLARQGRGMLAIAALIGLAEDRLAALRFERALPADVDRALTALKTLTDLRKSWRARDAAGLTPLVALTKPAAGGARVWSVERWMGAEEFEARYGSRAVERDGRRFVTIDGQELEVLSGVDAAEARLAAARGAQDANESRRRLYETLRDSEFVLRGFDGGAVQGLSYQDLVAKARAGQVLVFAASRDSRELRPAQHPLKALWQGPASVETVVYLGAERPGRDRFPTYESLREHVAALRAAGSPEADKYLVLEAGPKGLARMLEAARELRLREERAGWIGVKLQGYGVAVGGDGRARELYLTQEEFDAAVKAVNAAGRTWAGARAELAAAKDAEAAAKAERDAQQPATDAASAEFQRVSREAAPKLEADVRKKNPQRPGEDAAAYALRLKAALDEAVAKHPDVKAAQDRLSDEVEKQGKLDAKHRDAERRSGKAVDALLAASRLMAHAGQWNEETRAQTAAALEAAGMGADDRASELKRLDAQGTRRLLVSRDVALHIDSANNLVKVSGTPVFSPVPGPFAAELGTPDGAVRAPLSGELFAATMDVDGRLVKLYMDPDAVAEAGKRWVLVGIDGSLASDGRGVNPNLRVLHYADPETRIVKDGVAQPGTELPVMLNRRYMIELLVDSGRAKSKAESWAYGPWNWGNVLWEIPKGVLGTPIELLTGRDPNQTGYLGQAYMYKTEGGATQHHGFFRRMLGMLDILDLMPEHVDWYFDPSMFPRAATMDSPLLPGENIHGKDLRAGDKDVHFGRGALERAIQYQVEDLLSANRRVLSRFEGGVQETWLEDRRGRAGTFQTSRVTGQTGEEAVDRALDDPAIGADDRSLRPGEGPVTLSGRPGHVEVDRVERRVEVIPGARNYGRVTDHLAGLPEVVSGRARAAEERAPGLETERAAAEAQRGAARSSLGQARAEEAATRAEAERMAWRIGAQRAIENEMARLRSELAALRAELEALRRRLAQLEDELRRGPGDPENPNPGDPNDPSNPVGRTPWWVWAAAMLALGALIALILDLLRRRRPVLSPA